MPDKASALQIDSEIAAVRDNLRQLTEQAAAATGAADEDLRRRAHRATEALLAS